MKEITGFNNYYITTCGEVISKRTNKKMNKTLDTVGYYWVGIVSNDGILKKIRIHRLMGITYLGLDYNDKTQNINHLNQIKTLNYVGNLEITSNSKNTNDGYLNNNYITRNRIKIVAIERDTKNELVFNSLRECQDKIGISRKLIPLILSGDKPNNTKYEFQYLDYSLPYWIIDKNGVEFQSCRNCAKHYGISERLFRDKFNSSINNKFEIDGMIFEKFLK